MRSSLSRSCQRHVFQPPDAAHRFRRANTSMGFANEDVRRLSLCTPGGVHGSEVALNGYSSWLRRLHTPDPSKRAATLPTSNTASVSLDGDTSMSPGKYAACQERLDSTGLQVNQFQFEIKRQAPEQRLRRRKLVGERLADAGGLILGWRCQGAFGPMEVEKLTLMNVKRPSTVLDSQSLGHLFATQAITSPLRGASWGSGDRRQDRGDKCRVSKPSPSRGA